MKDIDLKIQTDELETSSTDDDSIVTDDLEDMIERLPENFPQALPIIQNEIATIIAECDEGLKDHYISLIKKRTKAASKRAVQLEIDNAFIRLTEEDLSSVEEPEITVIDPEIIKMVEQIARDPGLFKKRIEMVNRLGVIGERRSIGTYMVVIDSSLLPMGMSGSEALAAKNSGPQGSGKSYPLFTTLKIYPKSAYYLITSGSAKSLYNLNDGLKHKALILTEALQLQSGRFGDNELAYSIRTLVSEGHLKYQYTGFIDKKKVTIVRELKGPTSLLTTTIHGKLEEQLEDRMITIHPNTTADQTRDIISRTAEMASGAGDGVDQKTLDAWKLYYESLESVPVVIPYAADIAGFINRTGSLPISSRRAFKRVLATIKTIALIHQRQRARDDQGRVIADYADYALAYQLVGDSFRESLGEGYRYTDDRIRLIEKEGPITPKTLSKQFGITGSAVTQWLKPLIEKRVLTWCDKEGHGFLDVAELEKAKHSGSAHIRVSGRCCLPTPYQLTGNAKWDESGELYKLHDLGIEENHEDEEHAGDHVQKDTDVHVEEHSETSGPDGGVKVLSEKTGAINNFQHGSLDSESVPVSIVGLSDEFKDLLQMN